ncbi:MAG: cation diffusion facilitator family transporter [Propionibacteriaceae bacterium]|nr:cation diffusion facilitator family transporter [Propionibacteriaceae bacterium]
MSDSSTARTAPAARPVDLTRFAWLSIAAAIATIALKTAAWLMTGSVGLLSDAAESVVNLVAAVVALIALRVAAAPASERFPYGRTKAEYFSAAIEGLMILVAASVILVTAVARFLNPQPLEQVGMGLAISLAASAINGVVAMVLIRAGTRHRSLALTADGRHLLTDVWTSAGVLVGVLLVWITRWDRLDSIVAFLVGINIVITGVRLLTASAAGLLDMALPEEDQQKIIDILDRRTDGEVAFHGLMTRVAGQQRFATVHVLVPCEWTVKRGHDYVEDLETELTEAVPGLRVLSHLEPDADPRSYLDQPTGAIPFQAAQTEPPERDCC